MARLPISGGDAGSWGSILNDYLAQSLKADGSIKNNIIGADQIQNSAVTSLKLATPVQNSLAKADGSLQISNNLSDITNASSVRTNLGLGTAATLPATDFAKTTEVASTVNNITFGDSPYAMTAGSTIIANAAAGAISITVPAAGTAGNRWRAKKIDSSANIVTLNGIISGIVSPTLTAQNQMCEAISDGTNWLRIDDQAMVKISGETRPINFSQTTVTTKSSPISPTGLTTANLQTIIDAAAPGDTITIAAGTLSLTDRLFVPEKITLTGQGKNLTFIETPATAPIVNEGIIRDCTINSQAGAMPTNLLTDPNFLAYPSGYVNSDANSSLTITVNTSGRGHFLTNSLKMVQTEAASADRIAVALTGLVPGRTYTAVAWVETEIFTAAPSHGGLARGIWFQTATVAGTPASGESYILATAVNGVVRRSATLIPAVGESSCNLYLYSPQGTTYWSDIMIFEGTITDYLSAISDRDALLGGELVNVMGGKRSVLRPTTRLWPTSKITAKLATARDAADPLKVTIYGDSIAEGTDASSWMQMLFSSSSNDSTKWLGLSTTYEPYIGDVTNRAVGSSTSKLVLANLAVARKVIGGAGAYNGMWVGDQAIAPLRTTESDLAILCVGQNGGEENNAVVDTCTRLLRSTGTDVLLVATNPMTGSTENQGADRSLAYRQIADSYGVGFADLNTLFRMIVAKNVAGRAGGYPLSDDGSGNVGLLGDTVHPSFLGKKFYASELKAQLTRAARNGTTILPPQMASPAVNSALRTNWGHMPRLAYAFTTNGTITRELFNSRISPTGGWMDISLQANGLYVLPAAASYTDYIRFGSEFSKGVSLVILGNGATQTFEIANQNGGSALGTVTLASTLAGRVYTTEIISMAGGTDTNYFVKSSTGGKVIAAILYEPALTMLDRSTVTGVTPGLRLITGTWSLADYRSFTTGSGFGQLYGSDSNNAAAEFTFVGSGCFMRVGAIGQAFGQYQVYIDDLAVGSVVEGYNSNTEPSFTNLSASGLSYGRHVMKVAVTGVNASASASPGSQGSRRLVIAQCGVLNRNPCGYNN